MSEEFERVVLLLSETIRAEEDNKSHLFEQRIWRWMTIDFVVLRWVLFFDWLSGHASFQHLILVEVYFDEECILAELGWRRKWTEPLRPSAETHGFAWEPGN